MVPLSPRANEEKGRQAGQKWDSFPLMEPQCASLGRAITAVLETVIRSRETLLGHGLSPVL